MSARRLVLHGLAALLLAALLGALAWTLTSTAGLRFVLARVDAALAGGLDYGAVRGALSGPFELDDVVLELGAHRITIARLRAEARLPPLLVGRAHLTALEADGVVVRIVPDPTAPPFVLPARLELPLHLTLERFAVHDLALSVGAREPLRIASLEGAASADARGLRLERLALAGASASLTGAIEVGSAQPFPVAGALEARLRRAPGDAVVSIALGGRLEALEVGLVSAAPLAARAELTLDDAFGAPRLSGTLRCDDLALEALGAEPIAVLAGTTLDCDLALDGDGVATRATGRLGVARPGWRPATLDLALRATPRLVVLERGALAFAGLPLRGALSGRLALDRAGFPFALDADLHDLAIPTARPSPTLARRARLAIEGDLRAQRLRLDAEDGGDGTLAARATLGPDAPRLVLDGELAGWALRGTPFEVVEGRFTGRGGFDGVDLTLDAALSDGRHAATLSARGRSTAEATVVRAFRLALLDGQVVGEGRLEHAGPRWRGELRASGLDPAAFDARYPGRIAGRARFAGDAHRTTLALSELAGQLRGRPLAGAAALVLGDAPALESLALTLGAARLTADATPRRLRFAIEAPDLADLAPKAQGRLSARGDLDAGLHGELHLDAEALRYGDLHLARARIEAALPATGALQASVSASGLRTGDLALDALRLRAAGPRDDLTLELELGGGAGTATLGARGALRGARFEGTLTRADLAPTELAPWALVAPAALALDRAGVELAEACLSAAAARGCFGGGWHPLAPWRARGRVAKLEVASFGGLLPRALGYAGTLDLELDAAGDGPVLGDVRARLDLSAGHVVRPARRKQAAAMLLEWSGGRVTIERHAEKLVAEAALELAGRGALDATLTATGRGPLDARPLAGRVQARADHFALLTVLAPELKRLDGRFEADVTVAGTVGSPRYAGRVAFADGRATLPQYGLDLSAIAIEAVGDGTAFTLTGSARSGGTLQWRADVRREETGWRADGRLWGADFEAFDSPEARIIATPGLRLELAGRDLKVTGEVSVPRARLAPRSVASAVEASSDEVVVEADGAAVDDGAALRVDARIRLKLGDDVRFDGFGLKAKVAGEILLTERPDSLALASGELTLSDASYEAYGQKLEVERGRLLFSGGPANNPGLDVRASRTIERAGAEPVVAGIDVRGTLRRPETKVFTTPAMSSSDALAYLIAGRSLSESSEAEGERITDAASRMRLSGGEFIAQQFGREVGLDEVRVSDSGDPTQTQLWLGRWLSPKLFVSYGMGLYEQFHTARVRYQMSRRWSVEAESGRESSADVKYTIEH